MLARYVLALRVICFRMCRIVQTDSKHVRGLGREGAFLACHQLLLPRSRASYFRLACYLRGLVQGTLRENPRTEWISFEEY